MRFLIVSIFVLFLSFKVYSTDNPYSYSDKSYILSAAQKEQLEQAKPAVLKLFRFIPREKGLLTFSGTAFLISPTHVVTNWHVISGQSIDSLLLYREGSHQKLFIKRLVSISIRYDLVLLELKEESPSHLILRDSDVSDEEELFVLGYPDGKFKYTSKTSPLKRFDDIYTTFSVSRDDLSGNSGGPVLDSNNNVIGVVTLGGRHYAGMIKGNILKSFIDGDIGTSCKGQILQDCIKEEAINIQELAKEGDRVAQYELAKIYIAGQIVNQNSFLALKLLHLSADRGYAQSQYHLGEIYYKSAKNFSKAEKWYLLAAEQGHPIAQYELAKMYIAEKQDFSLALKWLRRSAKQAYVYAQYELGVMYYEGNGVKKNISDGLEWLLRSAKQAYIKSQNYLQMIYTSDPNYRKKQFSVSWE